MRWRWISARILLSSDARYGTVYIPAPRCQNYNATSFIFLWLVSPLQSVKIWLCNGVFFCSFLVWTMTSEVLRATWIPVEMSHIFSLSRWHAGLDHAMPVYTFCGTLRISLGSRHPKRATCILLVWNMSRTVVTFIIPRWCILKLLVNTLSFLSPPAGWNVLCWERYPVQCQNNFKFLLRSVFYFML